VRVLTTLLRADAGEIRVAGLDAARNAAELRRHIGLAGQYAAIDENLTGLENLTMVGRSTARRAARRSSAPASCSTASSSTKRPMRPAKTYSAACARRLDLPRRSSPGRPSLFLDEPTTGLDPARGSRCGRRSRAASRTGTTVLLTPSTSTRRTGWPTASR
jgi:ABC-2 type transport system ATP-binding protein